MNQVKPIITRPHTAALISHPYVFKNNVITHTTSSYWLMLTNFSLIAINCFALNNDALGMYDRPNTLDVFENIDIADSTCLIFFCGCKILPKETIWKYHYTSKIDRKQWNVAQINLIKVLWLRIKVWSLSIRRYWKNLLKDTFLVLYQFRKEIGVGW